MALKLLLGLVLGLILVLKTISGQNPTKPAQFHEIRNWRYLNFTWPDEDTLHAAVARGAYIPDNIIMSGLGHYGNHYYISLPRMRDGVPATLTRIPSDSNTNTNNPLLEPYPSWAENRLNDCTALQNVQNVEVDGRGWLWVVDGGRTGTLTSVPVVHCTPKLVVYDLEQGGRKVLEYEFPEAVASREYGFLYDVVVEDGAWVYVTDNSGRDPGIVVYSVEENRSWKIRHNTTMRADHSAINFTIAGMPVSAPINIAGIALGPKLQTSPNNSSNSTLTSRRVYYTPLSSFHLYSISSTDLQNENNAINGEQFTGAVTDHGLKPSQTDGMLMDSENTLYYGLLGISGIAKWDTRTPFDVRGQRLIARDEEYVQWPNAFTFNGEGALVVLVDRLQKFIYGKMHLGEVNFRLLASQVGGKSYVYAEDKFKVEDRADVMMGVEPGNFGVGEIMVSTSTEAATRNLDDEKWLPVPRNFNRSEEHPDVVTEVPIMIIHDHTHVERREEVATSTTTEKSTENGDQLTSQSDIKIVTPDGRLYYDISEIRHTTSNTDRPMHINQDFSKTTTEESHSSNDDEKPAVIDNIDRSIPEPEPEAEPITEDIMANIIDDVRVELNNAEHIQSSGNLVSEQSVVMFCVMLMLKIFL